MSSASRWPDGARVHRERSLPASSPNSVWMKRCVRSTMWIFSRLISSSFKRDAFGQRITPYGLLTVTSKYSPDADDGDIPCEDPQVSNCGSTARPDTWLIAAAARDVSSTRGLPHEDSCGPPRPPPSTAQAGKPEEAGANTRRTESPASAAKVPENRKSRIDSVRSTRRGWKRSS
jgi:hypothetical protein